MLRQLIRYFWLVCSIFILAGPMGEFFAVLCNAGIYFLLFGLRVLKSNIFYPFQIWLGISVSVNESFTFWSRRLNQNHLWYRGSNNVKTLSQNDNKKTTKMHFVSMFLSHPYKLCNFCPLRISMSDMWLTVPRALLISRARIWKWFFSAQKVFLKWPK